MAIVPVANRSTPAVRLNDPTWADMSDYVVHFAKPLGGSAYDSIMGILSRKVIYAQSAFGAGRTRAPEIQSQRAVCFSETPLHQLTRLAARRSEFGIGFRKSLLVARGGNPILYAYDNQPVAVAIKTLIASAGNQPRHPVWQMTPFIDLVSGQYSFEWEREWRVVGDLLFEPSEVAFLILPEASHDAARQFFADAEIEQVGPNYPCPFIDARWDRDRVRAALG